MYLALLLVGSWIYSDFAADPPAAPTVHAVRPVDVVKAPAPAILPATAAPASTLAYWPPGGPRHPACSCGGGGCNCAEAGKCVVVDSDCEPGVKRLPTAAIAPLPVPAVVTMSPPVVVSTVAPVAMWHCRDARGAWFTHRNKVFLEGWIAQRNVALTPAVVTTYASPPVYYSAPVYQPAATFGFGFAAGGSRCGPGGCR